MKNSNHKRLSRRELLELLIAESEKAEDLERQLKTATEALAIREIKMNKAGSIAEAALALNEVFEAAQAACAQYLENIERMHALQDIIEKERETKSREQAERIIDEARKQARRIEEGAHSRCDEIIAQMEKNFLRQNGMTIGMETRYSDDVSPQQIERDDV